MGIQAPFSKHSPLFLFFEEETLGEEATTPHSCDGHNDCGAGCVCVWSVAYCDHLESVLLSAVLFARWTNCGLLLAGGKCGQQTRRHRFAEVHHTPRQLHFP